MSTYNVNLKKIIDDSYEIEIGFYLMDKLVEDLKNDLLKGISKFAVITDSNVKNLYAETIVKKLIEAGYQTDIFVFPAGEVNKTRKTKEYIEDAMLEKGYRRDCCIIAVGGGVVTDLAGFVAGTFGRGIPFINYATTLLAAADASVGGKTAVDTPLATNLIGIFNQPKKVYLDIATWETLPKRQISSGLAETIKHACMASRSFFDFLNENMDEILNIEKKSCEYIAEENCKIKDGIVVRDEKEAGLREVLNLGHTVGRAIETVSGYRLLHGEALSIGLVAEVKMSNELGYMTELETKEVIDLLKKAKLPIDIPDYIDREELVKKLYTDKKVKNGKLRFVIQNGIGNVVEFSEGVFSTTIEESVAREIIIHM
ncbi:3-dehydroquinate synthase [Clostridium sp. BL-8]|uniref:3-dehydroquinate synthase n=1 Tax=Clostridium sp. BL-8 TaxID=349938 RepID=UPI00098CB0F8|nr:3-dehydroquinate synthase [Clostridium sp. BL-8]OOM69343.1 3-dehydroquinate synthase [Clostridium sp. BL-8]